MYSMQPPDRDHLDDYDNCVSHRRRISTRLILTKARPKIRTAYNAYRVGRGNAAQVHPLNEVKSLRAAWAANYRLIDDAGPMADMRGALMSQAKYGLCPMCGRGGASTLDHYLPKGKYPEFSAYGCNLVPACDDCNRAKRSRYGTTPATQFIHSYYHGIPNETIFRVEISIDQVVSYEFSVQKTDNLDPTTFARLGYQFKTLKLNKHFKREANLEMSDRKASLISRFETEGGQAVRSYLQKEAASVIESRGATSWKSALLTHLAEHNQFCFNGGVHLI